MSKIIDIFTKQPVDADGISYVLDEKSLDEVNEALDIAAHMLIDMAAENASLLKESPMPINCFQFDLLASHIVMQMVLTRHYVSVLEEEINHLRLQVEGGAA